MTDEGERFDAFLRSGSEEEAERLLDAAPTDALRRLLELRKKAQAKRAEVEPSEAEPDLPFERLGEYRLLRRIGEGGMGQLFLAEQESLGRKVALKVIQTALLGSATARERFRREALAAGRLQHPNLITVFASGEDQGVAFIAMGYLSGRGMDELIRDARPGTRRVVRWGSQLARALAYAHSRGVLHRDVKPSNVRINDQDEPVLIDFGIARDARWSGRTVTEAFTGSLPYAAPEQLAGRGLDGRTDVYALAVTLYEALTGRLPIGASLEARLTKEPTPPRRYNPALSPDLQTVLLKALERSPDSRYADADAFADDLEAVLELQPIAARPPRGLERIRRTARRHPRTTVAVLSAVVALVLFAGYLVRQHRERMRGARDLVAAAATRLTEYGEQQRGLAALESQVVELQETVHKRFRTDDEDRVLNDSEDRIAAARRDREAAYHEVLDLLRRAETIDPDVPGIAAIRTDLYMQRWRDARTMNDSEAERFYRDLVGRHDDAGRHTAELRGDCRIEIKTEPAGATVHMLPLIEQAEVRPGGDHRFVPVSVRERAGDFALRVVSGPDGWEPGDLILDFAEREPLAGVSALVYRNGKTESVVLPAGLDVRATAIPVFLSDETEWARTPTGIRGLERGRWLFVIRAPGHRELRFSIDTAEGPWWPMNLPLIPNTLDYDGFVPIQSVHPGKKRYWIMEREVVAREYLAFLNDPDIQARIDAADKPVLYPRDLDTAGYWDRDADGRFRLANEWKPDWPVLGISWHDAAAYARWRTEQARDGVTYSLPTYGQWITAGNSHALSHYPFGNRFRPKWVCSCYSQPRPSPQPVMRYPIDESVHGVFDMAGSAMEWLDDWYDPDQKLRRMGGGAWGQARPEEFMLYGQGFPADRVSGSFGFRLVLTENDR